MFRKFDKVIQIGPRKTLHRSELWAAQNCEPMA